MRDKPGKPVDFYHTCYCTAGLPDGAPWRDKARGHALRGRIERARQQVRLARRGAACQLA